MKTVAIILSGGKGLRLGSDIPKQYIEICGKSILGYTIDAFEKSNVDEIVLVAAEEYLGKCRQIADQCESRKVTAVIRGGAERYDSVLNGLRYLAAGNAQTIAGTARIIGEDIQTIAETAQTSSEIVLIHDGARPFIRPSVINEIIRAVETERAAIAAAPCTDTIKIADEYGCIVSTTDRKRTWAAQTPQGFRTEDIFRAYEEVIGDRSANDVLVCRGSAGGRTADSLSGAALSRSAESLASDNGNADRNLTGITDDAMVYQMAFPERKVRLINAGHDNFKITTADDLIRAESILSLRQNNLC